MTGPDEVPAGEDLDGWESAGRRDAARYPSRAALYDDLGQRAFAASGALQSVAFRASELNAADAATLGSAASLLARIAGVLAAATADAQPAYRSDRVLSTRAVDALGRRGVDALRRSSTDRSIPTPD
jgi:hypothetical protein